MCAQCDGTCTSWRIESQCESRFCLTSREIELSHWRPDDSYAVLILPHPQQLHSNLNFPAASIAPPSTFPSPASFHSQLHLAPTSYFIFKPKQTCIHSSLSHHHGKNISSRSLSHPKMTWTPQASCAAACESPKSLHLAKASNSTTRTSANI